MKDKHEKKLQEGNFLKVSKERLLQADREKTQIHPREKERKICKPFVKNNVSQKTKM